MLGERQAATIGPVDALLLAQKLCEDGVLLYSNAHRFWNDPGVMQGIWDLRDPFKSTGRMLVLLASPGAALPQELGQDVLILDEPLPSTSHLEQIVREMADFRSQWSKVQTGFVDEPRQTVAEADKLVASVMQRLAEGFANERSGLEKQWDRGDNVSTEDLRVALQRYRSFFDRLLKL